MNRFGIIAPAFNAESTLERFFLSIAGQSHENWYVVLIDDASTDRSVSKAVTLVERLRIEAKVSIHVNAERHWETRNVLTGIRSGQTRPNDIICRVDPDDYLNDLDALRLISDVYTSEKCDVLWTKHRWYDDERVTDFNVSAELPADANPYIHPWVSSHLKTFRRYLIDDINENNFLGADGEYIRRAGDQAIYLPILTRARKRVFFPLVTYSYRCALTEEILDSPDARMQTAEAEFLRQRGFVS